MEGFPNKTVVKNMGQKYKDSAKAAAEADRIASTAEQNLQQVLVSLRNCLHVVQKTMRMLEVDHDCICVKSSDQDSEWERRRRKLYKAANSIETVVNCCSLNEIETSFVDTDGMHERHHCPQKVGDDDLLWCDHVCVYEKVDMNSALWCNTPETILKLVFARLSLQQIFQLRSLSKHWRTLIMSPSFQIAFSTTTSRRFGIIVGTGVKRLLSLRPSEKKCCTLPLEFLPFGCDDPVTGDGGLLCWRQSTFPSSTNQVEDLQLYVCNPLTQAWRKLPVPSLVQDFDLLHLVTDRQTKQYTITIVNDLQQEKQFIWNTKAIVEVYNSSTNMWTVNNGIFHESPGTNLIYYKKYIANKFVGIKAYDQATGFTSRAFNVNQNISFYESMGFYPLPEYQGQIYRLLRTEAATSGIWMLRGPNHEWEKICSLPKPLEIPTLCMFSLHVSADVFIISNDIGKDRSYYQDEESDEDSEKCLWMLDRAQGKWIDVLHTFQGGRIYNKDCYGRVWRIDNSLHSMFELRLDGIP